MQYPKTFFSPSSLQIARENCRNIVCHHSTCRLDTSPRSLIATKVSRRWMLASQGTEITQITYPSSGARTRFSRLKHDDIQVGVPFLETVGCEGASNATPDDDNISSLR